MAVGMTNDRLNNRVLESVQNAPPLESCPPHLREAVELMIRQQEAEETTKAKKQVLPNLLRAALNAGGGYVKSPIVKEEFSEDQQEILKGLEVRARSMNS